MIGPVGRFGAEAKSPRRHIPNRRRCTLQSRSCGPTWSVQNRAATGGMISSATIRIRPTTFSPITVTTSTRPIIDQVDAGHVVPAAVAKSGSNATSVIGRRITQTSASASAPPARMIAASWRSIPPSIPAGTLQPRLPARDIDWMTVSSTMPKPKNDAQHRADRRVFRQARARDDPLDRAAGPTAAVIAEPSSRPPGFARRRQAPP
jgi:hypothetical protein